MKSVTRININIAEYLMKIIITFILLFDFYQQIIRIEMKSHFERP